MCVFRQRSSVFAGSSGESLSYVYVGLTETPSPFRRRKVELSGTGSGRFPTRSFPETTRNDTVVVRPLVTNTRFLAVRRFKFRSPGEQIGVPFPPSTVSELFRVVHVFHP